MEYRINKNELCILSTFEYTMLYDLIEEYNIEYIKMYHFEDVLQALMLPKCVVSVYLYGCTDLILKVMNSDKITVVIDTCDNTRLILSSDILKLQSIKNTRLQIYAESINILSFTLDNTVKYIVANEIGTFHAYDSLLYIHYFIVKYSSLEVFNYKGIENSYGLKGLYVPNNLIYVGNHLVNPRNNEVVIINQDGFDTHKFNYDVLNSVFPFNNLIQYMI